MSDKRDKVDPLLEEALQQGGGGDIRLRALLLLGPEEGEGAPSAGGDDAPPKPSGYASRAAYRADLIAYQRKKNLDSIGVTIERLKSLSLDPRGGSSSRTVVVEGTPVQIRASLSLPGVLHASLDRSMSLIEPRHR